MAYTDTGGSGSSLVFLHGTGCDIQDWDGVFAHLPEGIRKIALDFRGHGRSDVPQGTFTLENLAEDALVLIDHLSLKSSVLVGHSLGGMVALEAAQRSDTVAGLVLLEGWTRLGVSARAFEGDRMFGALSGEAIARIREKSEATKARFTPANWDAFWETVKRFDAYPYLQKAEIPILEAYGEMGRHARSEIELGVPDNPKVEWAWIPEAGHYLPHEKSGETAGLCRCLLSIVNPSFTTLE